MTGEKNSRKGNMEDEKKDEGTSNAPCEMDQKKHGAIVETHLPISEVLDISLSIGLLLNPATQKIKNKVVDENKTGDSKKGIRSEFNPHPLSGYRTKSNPQGNPPAKFDKPKGSFLQLSKNNSFSLMEFSWEVERAYSLA
jgi:hypothetical protein